MNANSLSFTAFAAALIASTPCAAAETVNFYYNERPPYFITKNGTVSGIRAEQLHQIIKHANLDAQWLSLPVNRIFHQLSSAKGAHCTGGWFKTAEREAQAWFSDAFAYNEPAMAIVKKEFHPKEYVMLSQLLIQPNIRLITKQNQYYGEYIESALKLYKVHRIETPDEHNEMLKQIMMNRADFMILNAAEATFLMQNDPLASEKLTALNVQDKTPIPPLFIMCNKLASAHVKDALNSGIKAFNRTHDTSLK